MIKRKFLGLLLFSVLVSPSASIAAVCDNGNSDDIIRNAGYRISTGTIKGAVIGGVVAAAAFSIGLVSAPVAFVIFTGVTLHQGVLPALNSTAKESINYLDSAIEGF